jgi:hypothetical protein
LLVIVSPVKLRLLKWFIIPISSHIVQYFCILSLTVYFLFQEAIFICSFGFLHLHRTCNFFGFLPRTNYLLLDIVNSICIFLLWNDLRIGLNWFKRQRVFFLVIEVKILWGLTIRLTLNSTCLQHFLLVFLWKLYKIMLFFWFCWWLILYCLIFLIFNVINRNITYFPFNNRSYWLFIHHSFNQKSLLLLLWLVRKLSLTERALCSIHNQVLSMIYL